MFEKTRKLCSKNHFRIEEKTHGICEDCGNFTYFLRYDARGMFTCETCYVVDRKKLYPKNDVSKKIIIVQLSSKLMNTYRTKMIEIW